MKNTRKEFLKLSGLAGAGLLTLSNCSSDGSANQTDAGMSDREQLFNMHGYAAPAIDLVRVGIIGMGNRGNGAVARLNHIEGVEVRAICDVEESAIREAEDRMSRIDDMRFSPETYIGEEEWKRVCDRDDLDLILVCTPWHLHAPMCVYSMESGKHVATEIPAAITMEECLQLVETSERTRKHCYQMTNMCYGFFEMVTLNMARDGFFGDVIHGEGAYIHQLMRHNFDFDEYHNMWRLRENSKRNGNLYPHHGLGMVALVMNINHGDRLDYMVSMSSNDFMMQDRARELAEEEPFFEEFAERSFRGNMNVSILRTVNGRTIMLQHDVTSPRPYSRIHLISGTSGIARGFPEERIATGHDGWLPEEEHQAVVEKYTPEITRRVGEMSEQIGGHGGADTMMLWRLIDSLRAGLPLDLTVYDAASWSSIIPLSEWSVANRSNPADIPDFTGGSWSSNEAVMDINLERVGDTRLI
ncbi:MAG: Gfo/Idh/MocA family protein [Bacteroidota bacterium]